MKKIYNKLVRDKIPQIIHDNGEIAVCETLSDENYITMLDDKLNEEVFEYQESKSIEELADTLEVIYAIAEARGYSVEKLEQVRKEKCNKRGAFHNKVFLKEVIQCEENKYKGLLNQIHKQMLNNQIDFHTAIHIQNIRLRKDGKSFTFSDHIKGLVYSLLSNQTSWKNIAPKLSQIDSLFFYFEKEKIGLSTLFRTKTIRSYF